MAVLGVGTDIVRIDRFRDGIISPRLIGRVFTAAEIAYCRSKPAPDRHFAARFAAKEAAIKALGAGGICLTITQVEVVNLEAGGPPHLVLRAGSNRNGLPVLPDTLRLHVSLSHDGD